MFMICAGDFNFSKANVSNILFKDKIWGLLSS